VLAVNLNGDIVGKRFNKSAKQKNSIETVSQKISELVKEYTDLALFEPDNIEEPPSLLDAIAASVNITQDRITRSRLAGEPPDIIFSPKLSDIGLLELYRAEEAIEEGRRCVERGLPEIQHMLDMNKG
jgi:NTE family protein